MPKQRLMQSVPNCKPEIGRWLWALDNARRRTLDCLSGIDPAAIDWASPAIDNTIGTLLYHIAAIEMSYVYEDVLGVGWADELAPLIVYDVRDDQGRLWHVAGVSLEEHLARLEATRALLHKVYLPMTLDEFQHARQADEYAISPAWVLHHMMQHEAEHRGQMMEARRLAELAS